MSGGYVRTVAAVLSGFALVFLTGCDRNVSADKLDPCQRLASNQAVEVCEAFSDKVASLDSEENGADYLVFRSYCDGIEERSALGMSNADEALAKVVSRHVEREASAESCVYAAELLSPRDEQESWAAIDAFDSYRGHRDALVIRQEPAEAVTPLDFSGVRPGESLEAIQLLPHIYRRQARNAKYMTDDAPVQVHDVRGFVLRAGRVSEVRFHRMREKNVDEEALTEAVHQAAKWFETMRDERRGRFYYEYDPYDDTHVDDAYNLLRHAGSTWSIMQAYGLTGDEKLRELGEYALAWVEDHSHTEKRKGRTIRYVVEPWNKKAKLGGAGLWLLALSEHARLTGDTSNLEIMQQIANHIYLAQDPETGKFESFHETEGVYASEFDSDYYPGEAMFGLHRARPFLTDIPVCEITRKGLAHMLEDEPRQMPTDEYRFVNQWNAYAIREYRRDCDDKRFDWVWKRDLDHMLATASTFQDDPVMAGAYQQQDGDFSTSPTRLEALTTICTELGREEEAFAERCEPVVRRVAGMQMSFQHRPSNTWLWPNPEATNGGFGRTLTDESIRIDFTQHHLSAMYNAIDFLRHVSSHKNQSERAKVANTTRSFPFNLVGDATCQQDDSVKCL